MTEKSEPVISMKLYDTLSHHNPYFMCSLKCTIFFSVVNVYFLSYHFHFSNKSDKMTDMDILYNSLSQRDKNYIKLF